MIMHRTWALLLLGVLLLFIAVNGIIWIFFTGELLEFRRFYNGGLDRLAYVTGSKHYRRPESTLPKRSMENADYRGQHVDVLTIGDSFLNVRDNGRDPLVQDWLASVHGLDVLNVQGLPRTTLYETVVILANSGYLDRVRPRFVILETVERECVLELARPFDLTMTRSLKEVDDYFRIARFQFNWPEVSFINTGNFKFLYYNLLRRWSDRSFALNVIARELDRPLFSVKNERLLLFYADDVGRLAMSTDRSVRLVNDHLNALADLLGKKGIRLYFMPAADKYNVYRDHIVNNPYGRSVFFELIRPLPKRYTLIDTKVLLTEEVSRGEKDVYYADDTHWSWKATKKIAEQTLFPAAAEGRRSTGVRLGERQEMTAREH